MARRPEPARQTSLRAHNLALVLGEVADHGPISRARIAAATGLTKASVSSLVDALVAGRLLAELGPSPRGTVGRPGSALGLAPDGPVGIGLELNVDYLATTTVSLAGAVVGTLDMVVSGPLFMDLMPADRRGELTGINMVLQNVFRALGALLGGAVFAWSGSYRPAFAAVALFFAVSAVILSRVRIAPTVDQQAG